MHLPISNRLLACCNYVNQGDRVADIGTDHGYLGIHLLLCGIAGSVIASDINRQPLDSALRNAVKFGVRERMTFYLSDGARNIPRDFDVMVCAGMGADTIIGILEAAPWLKSDRFRLILQCQTRRPELRRYLYNNGFSIPRETLAQDGKFIYPVMEAVYTPGEALTPGGYYLSPALLDSSSPLLPAFYDRVMDGLCKTVNGISGSPSGKNRDKLPDYQAALKELEGLEEQIHGNRC